MIWFKKFFGKKVKPIINEKIPVITRKDIPEKWSSSLIRESVIKINGNEWVIIDIGFEYVVVRNKEYNTWQIKRNLLER